MESKNIRDASEEILVCETFADHKEFLEKLKNNKDITKIQYKSDASSIRNPDLIDFGDLLEKCQRLSDFCFSLTYAHELTNDGPIYLLNAVSKINSVKKLSVSITSSNGVKEPALIEFARMLPSMPQLESLEVKLGHCGFPSGDAFLYYLNKALPKLTCLKEFAFSIVDKSTIDDMDLVELSQALQHTKALKSLRLKLRGERINAFNKFAENISSIQSLETLGFDTYELENPYGYVTVEQLNLFFDIPTKLNHLKTFEIRLPYAINPKGIKTADIQNMKSLENINLNARMFDAEALEGISLALSKLPKIKNVDLLVQSEPNTSVEGFGKHAQNWPVFENFKICLQSIDPKGLQEFVKVLKVNDSVDITFYPQYEAPIDSELFKSFGNISFMKRFCTSGLSLNETEFAMFIEGVKNMKSLKSFFHQNDRVSYLKTHLRDYGEALKTLPALESISLNITYSEITDQGIIDLLTELEEVKELKEFNISLYYCYEGRGDFIAKFIEWIGKHKKLEKVGLNLDQEEGTQMISDDAYNKMKSELAKCYPQIKFILNNIWHEIH